MPRRSGRNGQVYIDTSSAANGSAVPVSVVKTWSVNTVQNMIDVTGLGDGSKTYVPGLPDATGTLNGFAVLGTTTFQRITDGNARAFYLYPDALNHPTVYFYGTEYFSFQTDGDAEDAVKVTVNFNAASTSQWSAGI